MMRELARERGLPEPVISRPNDLLPERTIHLSEQDHLSVTIKQLVETGHGSGGQIWNVSELLVQWVFEPEQCWIGDCSSALELGSGTGLVAVALAKLGVERVIATDRVQTVCDLCL